jgi:phage shock protein PspC (stress-responsive transcriptional regulator)
METMTTPTSTRKLRRSSTDRMVAGVCGGWARLLGVDATVLRIIFVAATVFGVGTPVLLYAVCWILMPEED